MNVVPIGKLCELKYGKALRKDRRVDGDIPVFGSNGIVGYHNEAAVLKPTIVVGRKGSIGEVHLVEIPSWPIDTTYYVELLDNNQVDLRWFFRILRSLKLSELNRAAAVPGLNRDDVYRIEIPLPLLDDQKRIAYLLSKVEGLIAQREQHLQQLDNLLKSIFLDIFGDPKANPRRFKIRRLSDFYDNKVDGVKCGPFGSTLKKNEFTTSGIPVWNMDNISAAGVMTMPFRMWISSDKYQQLKAYSVNDGDIVISRAGTVGKMCVAHTSSPSVISTNLIRLRLNENLRPEYFVALMTNFKGRVGRLKTGPDGAFTHMNTRVLDNLEFPYPPMVLQNEYVDIERSVRSMRASSERSLDQLKNLINSISQLAFKSELNLTRIIIPEKNIETNNENENTRITDSTINDNPLFELPTPSKNATLNNSDSRKTILRNWLKAYTKQLGSQPIDVDFFFALVQLKLSELESKSNIEWYPQEIGITEYNEVKKWIFEELESNHLRQHYIDSVKRVRVSTAKD